MNPERNTNRLFFLFLSPVCLPEPRAADHEKVGPLQHRAPALLLLLQRRQGQSAAARLPRRGRAVLLNVSRCNTGGGRGEFLKKETMMEVGGGGGLF